MVKDNVDFKIIYNLCMNMVYQAVLELDILNEKGKKINNYTIAHIFMPHSLGHFIGLDVHDVGGRLYNRENNESVILKSNMTITIEPGIYFNNFLLDKNKEYWNENIHKFRNICGVRIEDVIVIKENGFHQLN